MSVKKVKSLFSYPMPHLLLLLMVAGFVCGPAAAEEGAIALRDFSGLQDELRRHGWRVEQSPQGDLLLWAPSDADESGRRPVRLKRTAVPAGEQIPATDIDRLEKRLSEGGWVVQRDESGGLLVQRSDDTLTETAKVAKAGKAEKAGRDGRLDELRALLGASGWRVAREARGDLLLYPKSETPVVKKDVDIQLSDRSGLKSALTAAGWKVLEKRDGSLLLYPESAQSSEESPAAGPVADGKVNLPVDSWKEAHDIAQWWLVQHAPGEGLMVGKVRKVNWVYLVSIVEESSPFRLNNQLAIREQDGTVVPLF